MKNYVIKEQKTKILDMAPDMLTLQEKTSLEGKIILVKASFALKICCCFLQKPWLGWIYC